MSERNTALRSLHDIGLAAWFGGSLMGAIGLNGAANRYGDDELSTARIASAGWAAWTPVNAAAIGAHLVGGAGLLGANSARVAYQQGVGASTVAKLALTGAALAATAYSRVVGKKVELAASLDPRDAETAAEHPVKLEQAQRQLALLQWAVPALTAGVLVLNALHGEQQRPEQQRLGMVRRAASPLVTAGGTSLAAVRRAREHGMPGRHC
ncbi:hypothetical protein AR457_05345 [Streptomyces agglomeratus]|uniref:hypothetical protein n=1 Tax=Streptomyces agglomeratus TaxID=285458 RepID=UPI00085483F6|nr:hypothetical protein [Streptomyces agglomeratus]OEJ43603.1 hypothetical protein AR457_05345 [Streptomyces agglomeratus]OEJ61878.1 hypothetical protein BGM19_31505 [Streptomyces agglomeratus]